MLAFGIRYLTGFVAAAEVDNMERAEWPPHPGRVFMALAAAHFTSGAKPAERQALRWLDGSERGGEISAPAIAAAGHHQRAIVKHYVPVNDKAGPSKALLHSLALTRERQDRVFARAWLEHDTVFLSWPDLDAPESVRTRLAELCTKVTRIGHSSSLVQMWLAKAEEVPEPNWIPDDADPGLQLRIPGPGTLDMLERDYNGAAAEEYADLRVAELEAPTQKAKKAAGKRLREDFDKQPPPRQRPRIALYQGYAPSSTGSESRAATATVFGAYPNMLRLTPDKSRYRALDLAATLMLTGRWRKAILSHSNGLSEPARQILSGHDANNKATSEPHLAFLPLAFIGHAHADGRLLGMGIVLPADLPRDIRREVVQAIAAVETLKLGPLGLWRAEVVTQSRPPWNLQPLAWTGGSEGKTHWSTVTPIVFDRHPKARAKSARQQQIARMIAQGCTNIGLHEPREVIVTHVSAHMGVPTVPSFPKLTRKDGSELQHTHAILIFEEPVRGPLLIGAGRFRGYGVCRPLDAP